MHDNVTVLHDNANRSRGLTQSCPNALMNHCYYFLMFILEWGAWGPYSVCSVTCGLGGQKTRYRQCEGGRSCQGPDRETVSCGGQVCQAGGYSQC